MTTTRRRKRKCIRYLSIILLCLFSLILISSSPEKQNVIGKIPTFGVNHPRCSVYWYHQEVMRILDKAINSFPILSKNSWVTDWRFSWIPLLLVAEYMRCPARRTLRNEPWACELAQKAWLCSGAKLTLFQNQTNSIHLEGLISCWLPFGHTSE